MDGYIVGLKSPSVWLVYLGVRLVSQSDKLKVDLNQPRDQVRRPAKINKPALAGLQCFFKQRLVCAVCVYTMLLA